MDHVLVFLVCLVASSYEAKNLDVRNFFSVVVQYKSKIKYLVLTLVAPVNYS